jgi:formate dehydrogenase alpha subunit
VGEKIRFTIDGRDIEAEKGENLLKIAKQNGFDIPNLCWMEHMLPTGSCRMCLIKINGQRGLKTACTVEIEEGMEVTAFDDEIEGVRRTNLEFILSDHNYDCSICQQSGECDLQDIAYRYQLGSEAISKLNYLTEKPDLEADYSSPVLNYEPDKCIKCSRCITACNVVQGKDVLSFVERGFYMYPSPDFTTWADSNCDGCGECVQSCPTGALVEKPLVSMIRAMDIDTKVQTTCTYCGVGCQVEMWVKNDKVVRIRGINAKPNNGRLCVKGRFGYEFINNKDRLTTPLIRKNGVLVEAGWDEALDLIASKMMGIRDTYGSDALAGLASARCTNEDNYIFQKFFRASMGTNNVDHCARLCHAPTVAGLGKAFGSGAMTNPVEEFVDSDCILITGTNATETHPVTGTYIRNAAAKGAKILVFDPRKIDIVKDSYLWMRQKSGTDVAWINGMINVIITEGYANDEFIKERTEGYEELKKSVSHYTPERVEEISGIKAEDLREAARVYACSEKSSIVYAMGITQHVTGTDNVLSLANLAMVTGQIGRASTGVNPLRGQNNVQGACDFGGLPNVYTGYQKVADQAVKAKFQKAWNVENLSDQNGLTIVEIMNEAAKGKLKGLYIMGENPMLSDPNLNHVKKALERLDFLVVQDIFLNETTEFADVVLPASSAAEKEGTFTNSDRAILRVRPALSSPGISKGDWEIICDLSKRTGYAMDYADSNAVMEEIAEVTPIYGGISYARLEKEHLSWPCPTSDHMGTTFLHAEKFSRGLGLFTPVDFIPPAEQPNKEFPFILTTGRMLYHYHTATMTRRSTPLMEFAPEGYLEISEQDLRDLGANDGDKLEISSRRGTITAKAKMSDRVAKGVIFIPFHFSESPVNVLTNDALDPQSKIPELKVAACKVSLFHES